MKKFLNEFWKRIPAVLTALNKSPRIEILLVSSILLSTFLMYYPTLKSGFIWDDKHLLFVRPINSGAGVYSLFFTKGIYYRPFVHLSMGIDYNFWYLNALGYHLTNIVLHSLNSILMFFLILFLFQKFSPATENRKTELRGRTLFSAFLGGMIFAVHPVHVESVAWIAGRTDLLVTFFFILAFFSFMIYEREKKVVAIVLTCLFFLFSLFSKENAMAFPLIVIAYGLIFKMEKKKLMIAILGLVCTVILYLSFREGFFTLKMSIDTPEVVAFRSTIFIKGLSLFKTALYGAGFYVEKLIMPLNLSLITPRPQGFKYIVLAFSFSAFAVIFYFTKSKIGFFGWGWVIITLLPSLAITFTKLPAPVADRYAYLPSVGFCLLIAGYFFSSCIKNFRVATLIICFVIALYPFIGYKRVLVWEDPLKLWEDTIEKNPTSTNALVNLGSLLLERGKMNEGKKVLITALNQKVVSIQEASQIFNHLGNIEIKNKNYIEAEDFFLKSIDTYPQNVGPYSNLSMLYLIIDETGKYHFTKEDKREFIEKAIEYLKKSLEISPGQVMVQYQLGLAYFKYGDNLKAEECFKRVIELDPRGIFVHNSVQLLELIKHRKILP